MVNPESAARLHDLALSAVYTLDDVRDSLGGWTAVSAMVESGKLDEAGLDLALSDSVLALAEGDWSEPASEMGLLLEDLAPPFCWANGELVEYCEVDATSWHQWAQRALVQFSNFSTAPDGFWDDDVHAFSIENAERICATWPPEWYRRAVALHWVYELFGTDFWDFDGQRVRDRLILEVGGVLRRAERGGTGDTRRDTRKKKRRHLSDHAHAVIRRYREERKIDPDVTITAVRKQYCEDRPDAPCESIRKQLTDNPEAWKYL